MHMYVFNLLSKLCAFSLLFFLFFLYFKYDFKNINYLFFLCFEKQNKNQSTYVKHLEHELETLRSDRSKLMQTILDLKQENEENAQVAARLDTDNGDERLSLTHRINELDEALQKANSTIKLMRQANQVNLSKTTQ